MLFLRVEYRILEFCSRRLGEKLQLTPPLEQLGLTVLCLILTAALLFLLSPLSTRTRGGLLESYFKGGKYIGRCVRLKRFHFFETVHVAVETVYSNIYIMKFFFSNEKSLYSKALRSGDSGAKQGECGGRVSRYGGCFKRNGTVILNTNLLLIPLRKKTILDGLF